MVNTVGVVILAAGKGKRMGTDTQSPKVLQPVLGQPIIKHLLSNVKESAIETKPIIVIAPDLYVIRETLGPDYEYAIQESQLGTGHAVLAAKEKLSRYSHVLVLYGDHPLVTNRTIDSLIAMHLNEQADMTLATIKVPHFNSEFEIFDNYGRIVRDHQGKIVKSIELKDTTEEEQKITEVNPCFYVFKTDWLWQVLPKVSRDNAQNEYYLTDVLELGLQQGSKIAESVVVDPFEALGINTPEQLGVVEGIMKERLDDVAKKHTGKLPI
jgi:bifunctional UDP-N-acetylglucosamine pyrophosphorylase / glucosamine-1-phosphate N-acetyltransferase